MQRRKFIQQGCFACMGLMAAGALMESCGTSAPLIVKPEVAENRIAVPLSSFSQNNNFVLVRNKALESDILLVKKEEGYKAIYMLCTHEGIELSVAGKKLVCPAHGSMFDFDGNVLREPALRPLKQFKTFVDKENIIIQLT